ncbi:MAG: DUF4445 domain-containing protein [Victivallales bacterium]|nr:DUF4445 domain-containing protein [Victivallales bacterium]
MKLQITNNHKLLSILLAEAGVPLDLRCGGKGTCGRCKVRLLSGSWNENGRHLDAPSEALACQTMLLSNQGTVEIDQTTMLPNREGVIANEWRTARPLPTTAETVVGFDIGTTTIVAAALRGGNVVAHSSRFNPQAAFGDNVISRISASSEHLAEMRSTLLGTMREMLAELPSPSRVAVAGNPTMTCIFHGIDPTPIGRAPFTLPQKSFAPISGECLGLLHNINVYTVPLVSAYLGGDVLGGMAEAQLAPGDLFIDLGTNCEMLFRNDDNKCVGSSSAAGPAFEGAGISCGMRAVPGAITHFRSLDDFDVIGDGKPLGLCGSALVDLLTLMRSNGRLTQYGRIQPKADSICIANDIAVTERDIETLLKAKAAVHGGILALERHSGQPAKRLVLAGGFAQYLDIDNAVRIGLLPRRGSRVVGNVSLAGAIRLAAKPEFAHELETIAATVSETPLNLIPEFQEYYIDNLMLP